MLVGLQYIECLGQDRRKIIMRRVDRDLAALTAGSPKRAGVSRFRIDGAALVECQIDAQPKDRLQPILFLAAPFVGFRLDRGRHVGNDDGRFDLVSVLAARAAAAESAEPAFRQELCRFPRRRMYHFGSTKVLRAKRKEEEVRQIGAVRGSPLSSGASSNRKGTVRRAHSRGEG